MDLLICFCCQAYHGLVVLDCCSFIWKSFGRWDNWIFDHLATDSLGCQEVVEEVPGAKELFDKASDILGYDLLKVCVEGNSASTEETAVCLHEDKKLPAQKPTTSRWSTKNV